MATGQSNASASPMPLSPEAIAVGAFLVCHATASKKGLKALAASIRMMEDEIEQMTVIPIHTGRRSTHNLDNMKTAKEFLDAAYSLACVRSNRAATKDI